MSWKQIAAGTVFGAALAVVALWRPPSAEGEHAGGEKAAAKEAEQHGEPARQSGRVSLPAAAVQRLGIAVATSPTVSRPATASAPGALQADARFSGAVRAPLAGVLAASDAPFPHLGEVVVAGAKLARVLPRLTAVELVDLGSRREQFAADAAAAKASLAAAERQVARLRTLNAEGKQVADHEVEDLEANAAGLRAKAAAAEAAAAGAKALLDGAPASLALLAPNAGEVVDVRANVGENVEAGAIVFAVADPSHLLARVRLPGSRAPETGTSIDVEVLADGQVLAGTAQSYADAAASGGRVLLVAVTGGSALRPGMPVVAHVPIGAARDGVVVPAAAIVRHAARSWVYVRTAEGESPTFERRPVEVGSPAGDGWFVPLATAHGAAGEKSGKTEEAGIAAGDAIVVTGAAALLGIELDSIAGGSDEEPGK